MTTPLPSAVIERIPDQAGMWQLVEPFSYQYKPGDTITVPAGFVTDLASIPRVFWDILPPFGKYTEAAIVHDYIYNTASERERRGKTGADTVLRTCMLDYGVAPWQVDMIYEGVNVGGQPAWDEDGQKIATAALAKAQI